MCSHFALRGASFPKGSCSGEVLLEGRLAMRQRCELLSYSKVQRCVHELADARVLGLSFARDA